MCEFTDGFPDRLNTWREERGLPQWEAAIWLGCHVSTLGRWERGESFPTQPDLVQVLREWAIL